MIKSVYDRLVGGRRSEKAVEKQEGRPLYLEHALKTMSPEDSRVIDGLRNSFEKRGKKQAWYYAAAGTDIVPVLIAPKGTTHHFVDPIYNDLSATEEPLPVSLEKSFLRRELGVQHQDRNGELRTSLPDGGSIEWKSKSADVNETVPNELDVVYTNYLSGEPNPQALQNLKVGGLFVMESPSRLVDGEINHPSGVLPLTDAGLKLLKGEITVQSMNPQDADGLLLYGYGGKRRFHVFEKTREFTPQEQADLILNYGCKKLYRNFRNMVFRLEPGQELPEGKIQDAVDGLSSSFESGLQDLLKRINEDVPEHLRNYALQKFMDHFGSRIVDGSYMDVIDWMFEVDAQTNEFAFSGNLDEVNGKSFFDGFVQVLERAREFIRNSIKI